MMRAEKVESYYPAWVREVPPTQRRKMRRYEVVHVGKVVAVKYTKHSAALLAEGLTKLMK
jgi:hypothetical protein